MEYIIIALVAFFVGYKVSEFMHVLSFKKVLDDLGVTREQLRQLGEKAARELGREVPEEFQDPEGLEVIHIKLEQHQGQIYAFRADNDGFLGQGTDRDSLILTLKQRMNNVRLIVDEGGELLQKNNG